MFQAARLLPWRSVMDNMLFVRKDAEMHPAALPALSRDGAARRQGRQVSGRLSGGMQQRVGIARAFRRSPTCCSWTSRSATSTRSPARTLRKECTVWAETGKTVVFVTHDVGEAVELSNRILVFAKGGRLADDIEVKLPFPRDVADSEVALKKAKCSGVRGARPHRHVSASALPSSRTAAIERLAQGNAGEQARLTASELVRSRLRRAILNGDLPGGTPLALAEVAGALGVSTRTRCGRHSASSPQRASS